jgi:hypothetical protein
MMKMNLALAQIATRLGDVESNLEKQFGQADQELVEGLQLLAKVPQTAARPAKR